MINSLLIIGKEYLFKVIIICFFLITSISVFSQVPELEFENFTPLEKITNSKSSDIIQDSTGYVWIATEEGLYRYDGRNIYSYRFNELDKNTIPSNIVNKLYIDKNNKLWVCTNEGLCVYNPKYDYFDHIITSSNLNGVNTTYISAINENNEGILFVANDNVIFKFENNTFIKVAELPQSRISSILFDSKNNIWIGAFLNGGIYYFDQGNKQLYKFEDVIDNKTFISKEVYVLEIINNKLWICTLGDGIFRYDFDSKKITKYITQTKLENFAVNLLVDSKKRLWICTYNGLKLYNNKEESFYLYHHVHNNPKSISASLWGIYEDKNGNFWTTSTEGGIKIAKGYNKFNKIDSNPLNFWHTSNEHITSISKDKNGNLWAGFYLSGIDIFKWNELKTERYINEENNLRSTGNGSTFSIFRDSKNQMWVGTYLGGLQKYNFNTNDFESYVHNSKNNFSIACNDVRSICEDKSGNLWLAVHGKGVDYFDYKNETFHHYNSQNNKLSTDYTFQVLLDSKNNLWVATSWGLGLLEDGQETFNNFFYDVNDSNSISSNFVHTIYEDQSNNLWIGTADGLNLFDYTSKKFKRFSRGLINKQVGSIISDSKGNIWVSTNVGISKLNFKNGDFKNFFLEDGLLSRNYSLRSSYKDSDNFLYFGGSDGIDFFNPDSLLFNRVSPKIVVYDFKISNKSINWQTDKNIIDKHISFVKEIKLEHDNNHFSISFLAVNPSNSAALSYKHILEGFDKDWVDSNLSNEATYSNLSSGKYRFKVRAILDNQIMESNETYIDIIIKPAWWMTSVFKVIVSLILLLLPITLIYRRIRNDKKQQIMLEKIVKERTREILKINEQLKSQAYSLSHKNSQLNNLNETKDKLLSIISHDLRSPFNALLGYNDYLIENYFSISDDEKLSMLLDLNSTTKQTFFLIENLLNWAKIQTYNINYEPTKLDIKSFMIEKTDLYSKIANAKKINFTHYYPENISAIADLNILETVVRNLITNSIKFTPIGGHITLSAQSVSDDVVISVKDNGIGMTPNQIHTLFSESHIHTNYGTEGEKGTGIGLKICKEFVEKNKGKIWVESQEGAGSVFNFTIPLYSE